MSIVTISHDGFARQSIIRETVERHVGCGCMNCGGYRNRSDYSLSTLFRYGTKPDDRDRIDWHSGQFCSKSCHDSYHG